MLGHHRLHEEHALLGIEAGANPVGDVVERVVDDLAGVGVVRSSARASRRRSRSSRTVACSVDPVLQRADEMPEVQLAGRAHARHHAFAGQSQQPTQDEALHRAGMIAASTPVSISTYSSMNP